MEKAIEKRSMELLLEAWPFILCPCYLKEKKQYLLMNNNLSKAVFGLMWVSEEIHVLIVGWNLGWNRGRWEGVRVSISITHYTASSLLNHGWDRCFSFALPALEVRKRSEGHTPPSFLGPRYPPEAHGARLDDCRFQRYLRLSVSQFEDLLARVSGRITMQDTNYRHSISAAERLSICLRWV